MWSLPVFNRAWAAPRCFWKWSIVEQKMRLIASLSEIESVLMHPGHYYLKSLSGDPAEPVHINLTIRIPRCPLDENKRAN